MPGYVKGDSYGQGTRIMKAASCPYGTKLTPRECARIREIDRSRQRADERRAAARRNSRERAYVVEERRGGECTRWIKAKGQKNLVGPIARYNAREAWRIEVRSEFGTQYQDIKYARQTKNHCWDEGAFTRCEFSARACRAGG